MHLIRPWSTHETTWVGRASRLCVLTAFSLLAGAGVARADVQTVDGLDAPIVRVNVRSGNVTIRTWDRPSVQIDADPSLQIVRQTVRQSDVSYSLPIPPLPGDGTDSLPAESFVATLPPGEHQAIIVRDYFGATTGTPTPVTVTVPADAVFVFARTGAGMLDVRDYRGGTLVAFVGRGRLVAGNIGGTAFLQDARGPMVVSDSSFDRIRARSLTGNMAFERCDVRQIEATSVDGSIVYDGGSFGAGLARFESSRGNVAVGSTTAAEFQGRVAGNGNVYTGFERNAAVSTRDGETDAAFAGGGPVVTASSERGNVFFYEGSLRARASLGGPWQAPLQTLRRPAAATERAAPGAPFRAQRYRQSFPDYPRPWPRNGLRAKRLRRAQALGDS